MRNSQERLPVKLLPQKNKRKGRNMTLRQNKVAIRLGNFVFHGDDYGVVIKRDETIIGDVWTFLSLSSGDIVMLREHQLTPYTRRKNQ